MLPKEKSSNLKKYETKNFIKKYLLGKFLEKILSIITEIHPKVILDAGCGEGIVLNKISQKIKLDKAYGIDISSEALKKAKNNYKKAIFTKGDVAKTNFKTNQFDLVIMFEVLEHLKNPELAIKEVKRISKRWCIFSVPNEPTFSILSLFSGMYADRLGKHPEHVNFWSQKDFAKLIGVYFKEVKVYSSLPWTIIVAKK